MVKENCLPYDIYFLNANISIFPAWISMKFLLVNGNIQMEGTVSQIFYIGPRFDFMIKKGKLFVIFFSIFKIIYSAFHKMTTKTLAERSTALLNTIPLKSRPIGDL